MEGSRNQKQNNLKKAQASHNDEDSVEKEPELAHKH